MEIYSYIKKDHLAVSEMFEKIIASRSSSHRKELFDVMQEELTVHNKSEQETFYKALEKNSELKDKLKHSVKEHEKVDEFFNELNEISFGTEKWMEKFGELKQAVEHHVEEEEQEVFSKAKKVLSSEEAKNLAKEMDDLKQEIKGAVE